MAWQDWYNHETATADDYARALAEWEAADEAYYSGETATPPGQPPRRPPGSAGSGSAAQTPLETQIATLYPWLPPAMVKVFADAWAETGGNQELALATMRQHPDYDQYFPGNRRPDGSVRFDEGTWAATRDAYRRAFSDFQLNPDVFAERITALMEGEVSPRELIERLGAAQEQIVQNIPQVREFYASQYGIEMTDAAILGSWIDPDIGRAVLDRRIAVAQVGGEALARGYQIDTGFADRLASGGVNQAQAREFFSSAESVLSTLDVLARRYRDPDDDFDLEEFAEAQIFGSAEQTDRIRRLLGAEQSSFSSNRSVRSTGSALSGLRQQ